MTLHRTIIKALLNNQLSLSDLQVITQVSLPTLRKAVQELTDAQWIHVAGQAEANGGRPAMLYGLNQRHFLIIGVHLQLPGIRLITTDLTGQVLDESEMFHKVVPTPDEVIGATGDYVERVRSQHHDRMILGIGIATPGFTDPSTGDIVSIGRVPTWQQYPFCRHLVTVTGVPVHVANDIDCMALAEFQYTNESFERNLAYVGFDEGVKVSLYLNGELFKGALGNAGLIASPLLHVPDGIDRSDLSKLLGIVGVSDIFDRHMAALDAEARKPYARIIDASSRRRFHLILQGAITELPVCRRIADDLIAALSAAIANVIYIVQPDVVVVGGVLSLMPSVLFNELAQAVRQHLPGLIGNNTSILLARLSSPNSAAIGATQHFLQDYLSDMTMDVLQLAQPRS